MESANRSVAGRKVDWPTVAAAAAVLLYAGLAGYRTVADPDLFWQLRDARYLLEQGRIARTEVFSYTAAGTEWLYPQGAGLVFLAVLRTGGFPALTWLSVVASLATTAIVLWIRPGLLATALTGLAVPLIAWRTGVRAELFTTIFFVLVLALLVRGVAERHVWLLPALMVAWVNLHPGFIMGLGLIGVFLFDRLLRRDNWRPLAVTGALCVAATVVNPFGPLVWKIPWLQARVTALHRSLISEWWPSTWNWRRMPELLDWQNPDYAYWVILFGCALVLPFAIWRRHWAPSILFVVFASASLSALRFQAFLGICGVVLAGQLVGASAANIRPILRWVLRPPSSFSHCFAAPIS